jgi:GNAT superfamily N-acetyltransferase
VSATSVIVRSARPEDWERVVAVMPEWWGGRDLRALLPRIFFEHFGSTSLIAERDGELAAFLVGFLCPDHGDEAYIHFVGVDPRWRRSGLARNLYERFFGIARVNGRTFVRAVTAFVNHDSIAFHRRLGFTLLPAGQTFDGHQATPDPSVPEGAVVRFELTIDAPPSDIEG